jgi:hypothetical protein
MIGIWRFLATYFNSKSNTLQSATVRINEAYGVKVFKIPKKVIGDFASVDTTGWSNWNQIHDSDTLMWMGAFNRNVDLMDVYNYGWGGYNFGAHSVLGDSLFLSNCRMEH